MKPIILKLGASFTFVICAIVYARTHFFRDPGSFFFDVNRAYDQEYSLYRKAEVRDYIDSFLNGEVRHETKSSTKPALCIALSSVKRPHMQYVESTVASLLAGITRQERRDLYIALQISNSNPMQHPSWRSEWLHQVVDDVYTYNITEMEKKHLKELEETAQYQEKGVFDYTYALQQCYDIGTPYVGIIEDDILLADGWMVRTMSGLKKIPENVVKNDEWIYMRLFNQERSIGWYRRDVGGNKEHWIVLGAGIIVTTSLLLVRRRWSFARNHLDNPTIGIIVLFLIPAMVILFFQSGKASLLPRSPGVYEEPFGCCSQAMIFPRAQVPMTINKLKEKKQGAIDDLLNELASNTGLKRYAMYPVQAQHIGLDSARHNLVNVTQAVWSMAFEHLNPTKLRKQHLEMVDEYYTQNRDILF